MAQTQIADVIVSAEFTGNQVENSLVSTALFQFGVDPAFTNATVNGAGSCRICAVKFWRLRSIFSAAFA